MAKAWHHILISVSLAVAIHDLSLSSAGLLSMAEEWVTTFGLTAAPSELMMPGPICVIEWPGQHVPRRLREASARP